MVSLNEKRPLVIAGPCSAETQEQTLETCLQLAATGTVDILRAGVWKPRTRPGQFEGTGVRGLGWMVRARELTGLPFGVEVATAGHVRHALDAGADMLWLGARTTGNPFSVQEIAEALRGVRIPVLVKNPMNPDLGLWAGAVDRLAAAGISSENIGLVHRGFSYFGSSRYRNTPMWHLAIEMRTRMPELAMLCDPSHICGRRELLHEVAQKAADLRFDGLMIESHTAPEKALSDASQQITPAEFAALLDGIRWRAASADNPEYTEALEKLRGQIDQLDEEVFEMLSRRMTLSEGIGRIKRENDVAILQGSRWAGIVDKIVAQAPALRLSEEFIRTILDAIHAESINRQNEVMNQ